MHDNVQDVTYTVLNLVEEEEEAGKNVSEDAVRVFLQPGKSSSYFLTN
jgi:hypothetical protein